MKKGLLLVLVCLFLSTFGFSQKGTIADARAAGVGATVTVTGVVMNGAEFGAVRYIQDATGGIAAYSGTVVSLTDLLRGDNVTISGTIKDYKQLLEIDPVATLVINSQNNTLYDAQLITPDLIGESYEGELVRIENVTFADAGAFAKQAYTVTANGTTFTIYISTAHPLIGTTIPTGPFTLTAICSQYHASDPAAGYQLIPRDVADLGGTNSISKLENGVTVYPNPVSNVLNISEKANVKIINLAGQVVVNAQNVNSVDMSALNNGMYIINIEANGVTRIQKVIKK